MDPLLIIEMAEAATQLLRGVLSGGAANTADNALAIEKIAQNSIALFKQETGQPMDLTKLQPAPDDSQSQT